MNIWYKSLEDGKISKVDKTNNLIFIEYKDGTTAAIDISPRSLYNSGGGFYIASQLTLDPRLKEGSTFKQGEILAYDPNYFKPSQYKNSYNFAAGRLTNVAIACLGETLTIFKRLVH